MDGLSKTIIFDWTSLAAYIPCTVIWIEAAPRVVRVFSCSAFCHTTAACVRVKIRYALPVPLLFVVWLVWLVVSLLSPRRPLGFAIVPLARVVRVAGVVVFCVASVARVARGSGIVLRGRFR